MKSTNNEMPSAFDLERLTYRITVSAFDIHGYERIASREYSGLQVQTAIFGSKEYHMMELGKLLDRFDRIRALNVIEPETLKFSVQIRHEKTEASISYTPLRMNRHALEAMFIRYVGQALSQLTESKP